MLPHGSPDLPDRRSRGRSTIAVRTGPAGRDPVARASIKGGQHSARLGQLLERKPHHAQPTSVRRAASGERRAAGGGRRAASGGRRAVCGVARRDLEPGRLREVEHSTRLCAFGTTSRTAACSRACPPRPCQPNLRQSRLLRKARAVRNLSRAVPAVCAPERRGATCTGAAASKTLLLLLVLWCRPARMVCTFIGMPETLRSVATLVTSWSSTPTYQQREHRG